jgi:DNA-binding CsgD family transcriptional regulator
MRPFREERMPDGTMNEQPLDLAPPTAPPVQNPSPGQLLHSFATLFENEALTKAVLLDALQRKSDGVVLIGREGEISFHNETARAILLEGDGLRFAGGRFATARLPETRRLNDCIREARAGASNGSERACRRVLITRPSGRAPYVVCVSPAPASAGTQGGQCVVHILDLAAHAVLSKEAACATFGLSDREADLAVELTRSANLRSAAAHAGMALNTARNHIHSIFAKCRVHSQVELSRILARLV